MLADSRRLEQRFRVYREPQAGKLRLSAPVESHNHKLLTAEAYIA